MMVEEKRRRIVRGSVGVVRLFSRVDEVDGVD